MARVLDGSPPRRLALARVADGANAAAAASAAPAGSSRVEPAELTQPAEIVRRPDPGIARGIWEAPSWALWLVMAAAIAFAALYAAARAGVLRRLRRRGGA